MNHINNGLPLALLLLEILMLETQNGALTITGKHIVSKLRSII